MAALAEDHINDVASNLGALLAAGVVKVGLQLLSSSAQQLHAMKLACPYLPWLNPCRHGLKAGGWMARRPL